MALSTVRAISKDAPKILQENTGAEGWAHLAMPMDNNFKKRLEIEALFDFCEEAGSVSYRNLFPIEEVIFTSRHDASDQVVLELLKLALLLI